MITRMTRIAAALVLWQSATVALVLAEDAKPAVQQSTRIPVPEDSDAPNAVVIALHGSASYSDDGAAFVQLDDKQVYARAKVRSVQSQSLQKTTRFVLGQGTVVRTDGDSHVDLFFRRIGTTVRLQPDSEVKFEKMARHMSNGVPVMETVLAVRAGRIFTVVRSLVPGSTFEIRNEAGRSVVEGGGAGRYIITADGTHVTEKGSAVPLKVIGESGITVIGPGMKYGANQGKVLPLDSSEAEKFLIDFDEMDSLADRAFGAESKPE